jgi:predicted metal-dependent HD superfamily phosphohydrolase
MNDFGMRLRAQRERSGKTRAVLGGLVGRSADWVKALESGRLLPPRLPMMLRLAEVLGVEDLAELTGTQALPVASVTRAGHPAVDQVASAMRRPDGRGVPGETVAALKSRVDQTWALWHHSHAERDVIANVLAGLLDASHAAARNGDRAALGELARVYHLTQLYLAHQPRSELVWLAADRGMAAAQAAQDPAAVAVAAWYYAHVYRSASQLDAAEEVLVSASEQLDPAAGDEHLARWGQLHLGLALTRAKRGEDGPAWRAWDVAERAASRLGVGVAHPWLMFGTTVCEISAVSMETDLCRVESAARRAANLDLSGLPSRTRRAAAWIEAARAHLARREEVGAVHLIGRAVRESADTVRYQPYARSVVMELAGRRGAVGDDARELCAAIGLDR